jgi:transcriptional regulator with XRE-family HTH domain
MAGPKAEDFDKRFGEQIARARHERDEPLSQDGLADAAGISRKSLMQIESGQRPARLSEANALAQALDLPLESLLGLGLDGTSDAKLRSLAKKLDKEHALISEQIREAEDAAALAIRQANVYRGARSQMYVEWIKVRIAMEKRGLDVQH